MINDAVEKNWIEKCLTAWSVDLRPDDARSALRGIEHYLTFEKEDGYEFPVCHIKYKGKWLRLVRTDLKDDVRTGIGICIPTPDWLVQDKVIEHFIESVYFGARVGEDYFAVVDRYSDG